MEVVMLTRQICWTLQNSAGEWEHFVVLCVQNAQVLKVTLASFAFLNFFVFIKKLSTSFVCNSQELGSSSENVPPLSI